MRFDEYDVEFFDIVTGTARASAARLVSYLVEWLRPENVIDVGCGEGAWLEAFAAAGCRVVGVDGPHVARDRLLVPAGSFVVHDLEVPLGGAVDGERFELAMSLEVGEHLSPNRADGFVDDLVGLADAVLWSAATPGQGGYGHINEQPHAYWAERFEDRGYACSNVLRRLFAGDGGVAG